MRKIVEYASKPACPKGNVNWLEWENNVWSQLVKRQNKVTETRACKEILKGRKLFNFGDNIPQIPYLNDILHRETGWILESVPAKISLEHFYGLLSEKIYPCITFIRIPEEMEYASAADVFHEIYGHCPMLTDPQFAHYVHTYGKLGLKADSEQRKFLMRLYMFTAEFGLVKQNNQTKIMGAGIMSSIEEAAHSIDNPQVTRKPLDILETLRTPYTLDDMQYLYFVADGVQQLYNMDENYIMDHIAQARELGMLEPHKPLENYFSKKQNDSNSKNQQQQQQAVIL